MRLAQLNASPHTIGSYRDTFRLLLAFASEHVGKPPCELDIDDLDAPLIGAFLNHLERDRGNSPRTRNNRLAAIHSLYRYAALRHPEHLQTIGRVIAIPAKRYERNNVNYLDLNEIGALLAAPDRNSWHGRRDHALLLVAIQTGLRVAELIGLRVRDVSLATGAHVLARGKGRKQRAVTPRPETVAVLRQWLTERHGQPDDPLFPTRQGQPLSPDAVEQLVAKHAAAAARTRDSLNSKHVTPHALRHTNAMLLRAGGADLATIALWLGHESTKTTSIYEHADPALKEQAIARTAPIATKPGRYRPSDTLLAFLDSL
ncbi:MAG TPA: tyrosine-type recombinase/integrase [Solirubrobacteraceae bacterium]|nr:tyrosine-type recombinase/integrase [Solirubrobacteraceae bacterium]